MVSGSLSMPYEPVWVSPSKSHPWAINLYRLPRFGHNACSPQFQRLDAPGRSQNMHGRRKNYRAWDAQQCSQEPVAPRDALPEDDLVFFLLDLVPQIDLSPFHQYYAQDLRGQPPFDVTMMVTLLVYAYSVGVCSSRRVAAACERNLAFRAIVGDDPPDFRAQAVVDSAEQIIVAAETTNAANDKEQAVPMAQAALDNLNAAGIEQPKAADGTPTPIPNTADTGYFSKEAVEELEKMGIDPHIATGRQKHHEA